MCLQFVATNNEAERHNEYGRDYPVQHQGKHHLNGGNLLQHWDSNQSKSSEGDVRLDTVKQKKTGGGRDGGEGERRGGRRCC